MPTKQSYSRPIALSTQEMKIVNRGLSQWGTLTRLEQGEHLNYPSQHYLDTLAKLGIRVTASRHCHWPHHLEQIDTLINQLDRTRPKWAKALIYYYTHSGTVRQQACQCGLAKSTFYEQLQHAKSWIGKSIRPPH